MNKALPPTVIDIQQEQEVTAVSETWSCLLLPRNVAYTDWNNGGELQRWVEERRLGFKSPNLVFVPRNNTSNNIMNLEHLIKFFLPIKWG